LRVEQEKVTALRAELEEMKKQARSSKEKSMNTEIDLIKSKLEEAESKLAIQQQ